MPHSANKRVQFLATLLERLGVKKIVISPGSRNGALTTEFNQRSAFECFSVVDERAAAFFALGMALESKEPIAICCTSGSAAVNYYPAVVEAFYQGIPLIVLTADRPAHLVDQFDGQTIRQWGVYSKHIKYNLQFDVEPHNTRWETETNALYKKLQLARIERTPIHVNFPMDEPIYDFTKELTPLNLDHLNDLDENANPVLNKQTFIQNWQNSKRRFVLVGKFYNEPKFTEVLTQLNQDPNTVLFLESTSNGPAIDGIHSLDNLFFYWEDLPKKLAPDFLLTLGQNVVSKKVKQYLRANCPDLYWHIDSSFCAATYGKLSGYIPKHPLEFLLECSSRLGNIDSQGTYQAEWQQIARQKQSAKQAYLKEIAFSDLWVHDQIIKGIPPHIKVHYGNSSPIRYSQLFSYPHANPIHCNRGTSGIEGSTSTAIGAAAVSANEHVLITGDISFFYEMNALWNNYIPHNFKIIVINNGGGNIFEIIPGPEKSEALSPFFTTPHQLSAQKLASMFGWIYLSSQDKETTNENQGIFWNQKQSPVLWEINTIDSNNAEVLRKYFRLT